MSVGVANLDEGHKAFFTHLTQIMDALDRQAFDEAEQICRSLIAAGAEHAAEEEAFLRKNGYPNLDQIIEVQKALSAQCQRLLTLIIEKSPDARGFADKTGGDLINYLLRSDINFKSFVQEMRDLRRLK
jgi:hemerythrin